MTVLLLFFFRAEGFPDLADRLVELQYELTDRLTFYICGRKPGIQQFHTLLFCLFYFTLEKRVEQKDCS